MDSRNSGNSSEVPASAHSAVPDPSEGDAPEAASIANLAEAMESKHRVRKRLARVLSRAVAVDGGCDAQRFDPDGEHSPIPSPGMSLEGNPLGEYLLNCELHRRPFTL